jgi:hypothetical protein
MLVLGLSSFKKGGEKILRVRIDVEVEVEVEVGGKWKYCCLSIIFSCCHLPQTSHLTSFQ